MLTISHKYQSAWIGKFLLYYLQCQGQGQEISFETKKKNFGYLVTAINGEIHVITLKKMK